LFEGGGRADEAEGSSLHAREIIGDSAITSSFVRFGDVGVWVAVAKAFGSFVVPPQDDVVADRH
jgi:hypothetical protein